MTCQAQTRKASHSDGTNAPDPQRSGNTQERRAAPNDPDCSSVTVSLRTSSPVMTALRPILGKEETGVKPEHPVRAGPYGNSLPTVTPTLLTSRLLWLSLPICERSQDMKGRWQQWDPTQPSAS